MDLIGHTAGDGIGGPAPLDVDPTELRRLGIELEIVADRLRSAVPGTPHLCASPAGWAVTAALTGWTGAVAGRFAAVADGLESAGAGMRRAAAGYADTDARLRMPDPGGQRRGGR